MMSVILPAYNEEKNIPLAVAAIRAALDQAAIAYELLLVDDGSKDGTFAAIGEAAAQDGRVRGLKLSRNFGKEAAILAGLEASRGRCCAVLDADLQHPPELLPRMYQLWQEGAMIVQAVKAGRGQERWLNRVFAGFFYLLISRFTKIDFRRASDYKLLDRKIVDILVKLPEKTRFFRGLSVYYGFPQAQIEFTVAPRASGKTNWSLFRLLRYALDSISSFTAFPLQFTTLLGIIMLLLFLILGLQTLYNFGTGRAVAGFTTVILLLLFIASALSISLGVIGHYIAKIYEEVKARPSYLVEKTTEKGENHDPRP
jgi:dolichol-phosphate mannosyltransferase